MNNMKAERAEAQEADGGFGPDFKPLTAEEAARWRARQVQASPWHVVGIQAVAGVLVALAAGLLGGSAAHGWSAAWGAWSVVLPAMLFARGLRRSSSAAGAGAALLQLMVWEAVKVVVTLALLLASPRVVSQLSWPALLVGFVVTMKMYGLVWWLQSRRRARRV